MNETEAGRYKRIRAVKAQAAYDAHVRWAKFVCEATPAEWYAHSFGGTVEEWQAYIDKRTKEAWK